MENVSQDNMCCPVLRYWLRTGLPYSVCNDSLVPWVNEYCWTQLGYSARYLPLSGYWWSNSATYGAFWLEMYVWPHTQTSVSVLFLGGKAAASPRPCLFEKRRTAPIPRTGHPLRYARRFLGSSANYCGFLGTVSHHISELVEVFSLNLVQSRTCC